MKTNYETAAMLRQITVDSVQPMASLGDVVDGNFVIEWSTLEQGAKRQAVPLLQLIYTARERLPANTRGLGVLEGVEDIKEALFTKLPDASDTAPPLAMLSAEAEAVLSPWLAKRLSKLCRNFAAHVQEFGISKTWKTAIIETYADVLDTNHREQITTGLRFNLYKLYAKAPSSVLKFNAENLPKAQSTVSVAELSRQLLRGELTGSGRAACSVTHNYVFVAPTWLANPDDGVTYPFADPTTLATLSFLPEGERPARLAHMIRSWFQSTYGVVSGRPEEDARTALRDPDAVAISRRVIGKFLGQPATPSPSGDDGVLVASEHRIFDTVGRTIDGAVHLASPAFGVDFAKFAYGSVKRLRRRGRLYVSAADAKRLVLASNVTIAPDDLALLDALIGATDPVAQAELLRSRESAAVRAAGGRVRAKQAFSRDEDARLIAEWKARRTATEKAAQLRAFAPHARYRIYWRERLLVALFRHTYSTEKTLDVVRDPARLRALLGKDAATYQPGLDVDLTAAPSPAPAETAAP